MLSLYYPGTAFVTVSITGKECDLRCAHCGARFLGHMVPATSPEALFDIAMQAKKDGCLGMLVSGGSDSEGVVPIFDYLNTIENIKNDTKLIINVHTGFIEQADIQRLSDKGIDIVSFDVVGSSTAVKNVYGLDLDKGYFEGALAAFKEASLNVVPHVTAGLDGGGDSGEEAALELIAKAPPKMVIVNALMGSGSDEDRLMKTLDMANRILSDDVKLSVGCMRPRDIELDALELIQLGVTSVAMPSKRFIKQLVDNGIEHEFRNGCCALDSL